MSALPSADRIELSPAVRAILDAESSASRSLEHYLRYLRALLAPDLAGIDDAVAPDVRCHELDAIGLPRGPEGLKMFRRQVNAAIPDEHILVTAISIEGDDIIEADLSMRATQTGEIFGIPATGRAICFDVRERCRFVECQLAERWAQVDLEDIKRQLTGHPQQTS
jgi:predicted ester cyclase